MPLAPIRIRSRSPALRERLRIEVLLQLWADITTARSETHPCERDLTDWPNGEDRGTGT